MGGGFSEKLSHKNAIKHGKEDPRDYLTTRSTPSKLQLPPPIQLLCIYVTTVTVKTVVEFIFYCLFLNQFFQNILLPVCRLESGRVRLPEEVRWRGQTLRRARTQASIHRERGHQRRRAHSR